MFYFDGSAAGFPFDDDIYVWFIVTDRFSAHLFRISLGLKAILGVLIWHLIVNFGVYLNSIPARPLLEVYVSAWPFDFRLLVAPYYLLFVLLTERMISKRLDRSR